MEAKTHPKEEIELNTRGPSQALPPNHTLLASLEESPCVTTRKEPGLGCALREWLKCVGGRAVNFCQDFHSRQAWAVGSNSQIANGEREKEGDGVAEEERKGA